MKTVLKGVSLLLASVTVLVFLSILNGAVCQAGEKKTFDTKKRAFCQLMLSHGADAYARGQFEKAGYYFSQAVKADPANLAKIWYELKGIKAGRAGSESAFSAPVIKQQAPSTPAPAQEKEQSAPGVIMGDDEGC